MHPAITELIQAIMATMIAMIPPGYSSLSRLPIDYCDQECQDTPLCEEWRSNWRCKRPQLDRRGYRQRLAQYQKEGMSFEKARKEAKLRSYTRPETKEEGLARYAIVATAVSDVSRKMTRHMCKSKCKGVAEQASQVCENPEDETMCKTAGEEALEACHKDCNKQAPWRWRRMELIYSALTVMQKESGFRADVHGGTGMMGRGDCDWKYPDGRKAKAWTKGTSPIGGTCRSVCLGQINVGKGRVGPNRWSAEDLVGVDLGSTSRCVTQTMRELSRSRLTCRKSQDWAGAMFSAYGTGWSCTNKKLMARGGAFWKHFKHRRTLTQHWSELLVSPGMSQAYQRLYNSPSRMLWMIPVETPELDKAIAKVLEEVEEEEGEIEMASFDDE